MLKDLETAVKATQKRADEALETGNALVATFQEMALSHVDGLIAECLEAALTQLAEQTARDIEVSSARIREQFDELGDILLGRHPKSVGPNMDHVVENLRVEAADRAMSVRQLINEKLTNFRGIVNGVDDPSLREK
jgi:hypothetical protein